MNALANQEVGKYLNTHFVSAFQKVGTFRLTGGGKQGGNVASYFCTPDGRVQHVIAGPVSAEWFLREARWVVETWKLAVLEHRDAGPKLEAFFAKAHADRLHSEHGIVLKNASSAQPRVLGRSAPAKVHLLLARAPLVPIEQLYQVIFEKVLGEKISTNPVVPGVP